MKLTPQSQRLPFRGYYTITLFMVTMSLLVSLSHGFVRGSIQRFGYAIQRTMRSSATRIPSSIARKPSSTTSSTKTTAKIKEASGSKAITSSSASSFANRDSAKKTNQPTIKTKKNNKNMIIIESAKGIDEETITKAIMASSAASSSSTDKSFKAKSILGSSILRKICESKMSKTNDNNSGHNSNYHTNGSDALQTPPEQRNSTISNPQDVPLVPIHIKNSQKRFPINMQQVREDMDILRTLLGVRDFTVDIWFCSDEKIKELNEDYRDKSKPTDILSFPITEFSPPEVLAETLHHAEEKVLGDMIISPAYVHRQCLRDIVSFNPHKHATTTTTNNNNNNNSENSSSSSGGGTIMSVEEARALLALETETDIDPDEEVDYTTTTTSENNNGENNSDSDNDEDEHDRGISRAMSRVFTFEERLPLLLIHGLLHLLGHDHETPSDHARMTTREEEILCAFQQQKRETREKHPTECNRKS